MVFGILPTKVYFQLFVLIITVAIFSIMTRQERLYNSSLSDWSVSSLCYRLCSSPARLSQSECRLLQPLVGAISRRDVKIGPNTYIHTLHIQHSNPLPSNRPPLLLLHGMGAGIGLFVKNLSAFSDVTDVYAIDLLGFGGSSKPIFSSNPSDVIGQFVQSIEDWRSAVGLHHFILLGHSFGGYLASCYSLEHPARVARLILAEPWGYPPVSCRRPRRANRNLPVSYRLFIVLISIVTLYLRIFQPFFCLRWSFGLGRYLLLFTRGDLFELFRGVVSPRLVCDYIYDFNCQYPSGETAFSHLHIPFGWCKLPLLPDRIQQLDRHIPVHFLYGTLSWMRHETGQSVKYLLSNLVTIDLIEGAMHHIYAEATGEFNRIVCKYLREETGEY